MNMTTSTIIVAAPSLHQLSVHSLHCGGAVGCGQSRTGDPQPPSAIAQDKSLYSSFIYFVFVL